MSMNRENIERQKDRYKDGPDAGWEKMEDTAVETEEDAPLWNKGMEGVSTTDHQPHGSEYIEGGGPPKADEFPDEPEAVPRSGDLTRPVGTESDSY